MKKIHRKQRGKMYEALRVEIVNNDTSGFIGDLRRLCVKYKLPDLTLLPLRTRYIKSACKDMSKRRCLAATLTNKKVPSLLSLDKIQTHHYTYGVKEARAITVMRTGNLIFKNWAPHKIITKHKGDLKCLDPICQERDSLAHVLNCEYYDTKYIETSEGNIRDWATYLVKFHLKSEGTHNIIREMKKDAEMTEHIMEQTNRHFNHNASIESLTFFQKLTQGIGLACIVAIVVAIIIYCCRKF